MFIFVPRSTSTLKSKMWRVALEAGQFSDFDSLLNLFSFEMHLSALETLDQKVFQRIGEVLQNKRSENSVHLFLHVNEVITRSLQKAIFESLPNIASIRYKQLNLILFTFSLFIFIYIYLHIFFYLSHIYSVFFSHLFIGFSPINLK